MSCSIWMPGWIILVNFAIFSSSSKPLGFFFTVFCLEGLVLRMAFLAEIIDSLRRRFSRTMVLFIALDPVSPTPIILKIASSMYYFNRISNQIYELMTASKLQIQKEHLKEKNRLICDNASSKTMKNNLNDGNIIKMELSTDDFIPIRILT